MGFLFVRRSRYEALRKDLQLTQIELGRKDRTIAALRDEVAEWKDEADDAYGEADAAEAKLTAIAQIISGEAKAAEMPVSESVLEGE